MVTKCFVLVVVWGLFCYFPGQSVAAPDYDFNFDFENNTDHECDDFHVYLNGDVRGKVHDYYDGIMNPFGPGEEGAYNPFTESTAIEFDGATVPIGQMIHIGFNVDGQKLEKGGDPDFAAYWTWSDPTPGRQEAPPVAGCWKIYNSVTSSADFYVNNDAGANTITVYDFNYNVTPTRIPLNNLMWDQIAWTSLPGTYDLAPGQVTPAFNVPGVAPSDYVVFGWKAVWQGQSYKVRAIFQQRAVESQAIPALNIWGLLALVIVLLGISLWVLRIRRRPANGIV